MVVKSDGDACATYQTWGNKKYVHSFRWKPWKVETDNIEDTDVDERVIFLHLKEVYVTAWSGLQRLRIRSNDGFYRHGTHHSGSIK